MTTTKQALEALRALLASPCIANCDHEFKDGEDHDAEFKARAILAAYDARPAASDEQVEAVARALARKARVSEMEANGFNGIHLNEYVEMCWADHKDRARAAIAAMPPLKIRIGKFVLRHAPNGIWIGRADGEGGEFATEDVERVIAQFYKEQF